MQCVQTDNYNIAPFLATAFSKHYRCCVENLNKAFKLNNFLATLCLLGSTISTVRMYDTWNHFLSKSSAIGNLLHHINMHNRKWPFLISHFFVRSFIKSFPLYKLSSTSVLYDSASDIFPNELSVCMECEENLKFVRLLSLFSSVCWPSVIFLRFLWTDFLSVIQKESLQTKAHFLKWQLTKPKYLEFLRRSQNDVKLPNALDLAWLLLKLDIP